MTLKINNQQRESDKTFLHKFLTVNSMRHSNPRQPQSESFPRENQVPTFIEPRYSSLNSPNSGIELFYAESGFFDGKNLDFWQIGSKPFLWRILKTGEKAICRHVTEPLCISQREKVKREILRFWWSSFCLNLQVQEL